MSDDDTVIPAEYVEFCKKVAALAADAKLSRMSMKITPGFYGAKWQSDINMHWDNGRHGDSARKLFISSEVTVHATVAVAGGPRDDR
jgi:hypothetical protein